MSEEAVHERFLAYCRFGDKTNAGDMDNATFAKMAKETGIINKNCTKVRRPQQLIHLQRSVMSQLSC